MAAPSLDASGGISGSGVYTFNWTGSTHSSAQAITTGVANGVIVLCISDEPFSNTAQTVSSVSNPGTDPSGSLTWNKLAGASFTANGTGAKSDCEVWWALAPTAGTYHVTVTTSGTTDGAAVVGLTLKGCNTSQPYDSGVTSQGTGTSTSASATVTSNTSEVFWIEVLGSGSSLANSGGTPTWQSTPASVANKTVSETGGSGVTQVSIAWGSTTSGLTAATFSAAYTLTLGGSSPLSSYFITVGFTADSLGSPSAGTAGGSAAVSGVTQAQKKAAGAAGGTAAVGGRVGGFVGTAGGGATVSGVSVVSGKFAAFENTDKFSAFGRQPISAVWASTEQKDILVVDATTPGVSGQFNTAETIDKFSAAGYTVFVGQWASQERSDIFQAYNVPSTRRRRIFFAS